MNIIFGTDKNSQSGLSVGSSRLLKSEFIKNQTLPSLETSRKLFFGKEYFCEGSEHTNNATSSCSEHPMERIQRSVLKWSGTFPRLNRLVQILSSWAMRWTDSYFSESFQPLPQALLESAGSRTVGSRISYWTVLKWLPTLPTWYALSSRTTIPSTLFFSKINI